MAKRARIIVVGCSMFGTAVARALSGAGHDVIAVDMQEGALDALGDDFDGEIITGDGKSAQVLEECGVRDATHLVAATSDDAPRGRRGLRGNLGGSGHRAHLPPPHLRSGVLPPHRPGPRR